MFIKVHAGMERHNGTRWYLDNENLITEYINTDVIEEVVDQKTYTILRTNRNKICVKESADEIMKIITYFKVGNDK